MKHAALLLIGLFAFVMLTTGCRSMTGRSMGQHLDDKMTTAQVKTKLATEGFRNLISTDVDTWYGTVYLQGTVPFEADKAEAERIAIRSPGVKKVVNNLHVVSNERGREARAARRAAAPASAATPAASPPTAPAQSTVTGQVTEVHDDGQITVRTDQGDMLLRLPAAAHGNIKAGDRISINVGLVSR